MKFPIRAAVLALLPACGSSATTMAPHSAGNSSSVMAPYMGGYRLPFDGNWRVHRTHYGLTNDQAFAVDLVVDAPHPARGGRNSDYPTYGQRILADGPGVVAVAVDGVPDNDPGIVNGYHAHGNYVVLDHRNGEFSLFAHLIPGTIRVRAGQTVAMGQELGLCGNSGHSTMAHLHWQVMDHPEPHRAHARPLRLVAYEQNGRLSTGRLQRGDVVRAVP